MAGAGQDWSKQGATAASPAMGRANHHPAQLKAGAVMQAGQHGEARKRSLIQGVKVFLVRAGKRTTCQADPVSPSSMWYQGPPPGWPGPAVPPVAEGRSNSMRPG